jgi:U3 small nucleolar RNA-associated protein 23
LNSATGGGNEVLTIILVVDSDHLRTLHACKMPLQRYLEKTLHGTAKPFITKCSLASALKTTELRTSQRPDFLPPPTKLPLRHCSHADIGTDEVLPEMECLFDLLSGGARGNQQPKNKEHFVLATADHASPQTNTTTDRKKYDSATENDIRPYVREIPGVPIIYVKRSVMVLEELSRASLAVRLKEEKQKLREGLVKAGDRKRKRDDDREREGEGNADKEKTGDAIVAAAPKKKRVKGTKGPNPLSVMKKKKKGSIPKQKDRVPRDSVTNSHDHTRSSRAGEQHTSHHESRDRPLAAEKG